MKTDRRAVRGIILAFVIIIGLILAFCAYAIYSFYGLMGPHYVAITELTEPLKTGIGEQYGYIIPDNAQLVFGRAIESRESSLELYFSVELDGLPGYIQGMEPSGIYKLMWDGEKSDVDYEGIAISEIEDFEEAHDVEFPFVAHCKKAPFSGICLSKPKDGKVFVYISGYRPSSDWFQ